MNHPRSEQITHTVRAVGWAAIAVALAILAGFIALTGSPVAAGMAAAACASAIVLTLRSRNVARRNRIGADAERDVGRRLDELAQQQGWLVEHGLRWQGPGDIDHFAAAPGGARFAIETKTLRYQPEHLDRLRRAAASTAAQPVLCIARTRRVCRVEDGVLVVSLDRVSDELVARAGVRRL